MKIFSMIKVILTLPVERIVFQSAPHTYTHTYYLLYETQRQVETTKALIS